MSIAPVGNPVVVIPAPSAAPAVVVQAPAAPAVVRVQSLGVQGPPGPQGAPGYAKRFGTIDYTDNDAVVYDGDGAVVSGTPLRLEAGQWVRITRNLTPSGANFNLPSGPWADFTFWDNTAKLLRARMAGDVLIFKFSYVVIPDQRNDGLGFSVRPDDSTQFEFGPDPISIVTDAGNKQPGSETFMEQCRTRFVNFGASIYVMSNAGATLLSFSPEVAPHDFAPATT